MNRNLWEVRSLQPSACSLWNLQILYNSTEFFFLLRAGRNALLPMRGKRGFRLYYEGVIRELFINSMRRAVAMLFVWPNMHLKRFWDYIVWSACCAAGLPMGIRLRACGLARHLQFNVIFFWRSFFFLAAETPACFNRKLSRF